jgi:mannosyltransferase OCH1-like enzyme
MATRGVVVARDWMLVLEAHEIPSRSLVEQLPALLDADDVGIWLVPCRSLFPDARHWLAGPPWFPRWEPRLTRRGGGATVCRANAAVYDLGFVSRPLLRRWEEALRDDVEATQSATEDPRRGFAFRLPERHERLELEPVDEPDRAALEAALPAARWAAENTVRVLETADRAEVEALTMPALPPALRGSRARTLEDLHPHVERTGEIPRILHRVWLGGGPIPERFHRYGESWERHHPGWEHRLWTEESLPRLECARALERARFFAEQSDLVRYELLARFGGVYVDMDFECLRPLDPLLRGVTAFAGLERPGWVQNAILGATPGHPAFRFALSQAIELAGLGLHTIHATGPFFLSRVLAEFRSVVLFAPHVFYPQGWQEADVEPDRLARSYAVHRWAKTHVGRTDNDDVEAVVAALA